MDSKSEKSEFGKNLKEVEASGHANVVFSRSVGVQCQLSLEAVEEAFEISDTHSRRGLVRRMYTLFIVQYLIAVPVMVICLRFVDEPTSALTLVIMVPLTLVVYALLYKRLRRQRRKAPWNYVVFSIITIMHVALMGFSCVSIRPQTNLVLLYPGTVVVQLIVLMAYTQQQRLIFTNGRGMCLILLVVAIYVGAVYLLSPPNLLHFISLHAVIDASFIIYDTQLMMSGHHGYHLRSDEYVYAATNIYADWPLFIWDVFKHLVLEHVLALIRFLRKCCGAEVC